MANHRPKEVQVVLRRNRLAIVCDSARDAIVAHGELAAVPVETSNNQRGTVLVDAGCDGGRSGRIRTSLRRRGPGGGRAVVLTHLGLDIDQERLVEVSGSASMLWAQRLGYILTDLGTADEAVLLKEHARPSARNCTTLLPCSGTGGALRSTDWRLFVNG